MSFFCMLEAQPTTTVAQRGENDKHPLRPSASSNPKESRSGPGPSPREG